MLESEKQIVERVGRDTPTNERDAQERQTHKRDRRPRETDAQETTG